MNAGRLAARGRAPPLGIAKQTDAVMRTSDGASARLAASLVAVLDALAIANEAIVERVAGGEQLLDRVWGLIDILTPALPASDHPSLRILTYNAAFLSANIETPWPLPDQAGDLSRPISPFDDQEHPRWGLPFSMLQPPYYIRVFALGDRG